MAAAAQPLIAILFRFRPGNPNPTEQQQQIRARGGSVCWLLFSCFHRRRDLAHELSIRDSALVYMVWRVERTKRVVKVVEGAQWWFGNSLLRC